MRIRRLHIGDFGILRNQTLSDLAPGLVVVGGPNRAGKTSFMQVLRYLGYGFPKGVNLPPATHEYHVEATVALENKIWELLINGYGKPRVVDARGDSIPADLLFGELDMFTYHRLFTISLDELRLLPEGVSKEDQGRLQSVLLGAGLADVARLPQLQRDLEAVAHKIGGKHGNIGVWMFKPYHELIRKGTEQRDAALELVDGYRAKTEKLAIIDTSIEEAEKELGHLEQRVVKLETLLHNYDDYQRWSELNRVLSDPEADVLLQHYPEGLWEKAKALQGTHEAAVADYRKKFAIVEQQASGREMETWQEALLDRATDIDLELKNLSGLSARIESYERRQLTHQGEQRRIEADIISIEPSWQGSFEKLDEIVEEVDQDRLLQAVAEHECLDEAVGIWQRLQRISIPDYIQQLRMYAIGAAVALVMGMILGIWQPVAGTGLVVIGAVGLGLYLVFQNATSRVDMMRKDSLVEQLMDISGRIGVSFDVDNPGGYGLTLQAQLDETKERLESYRVILGLTEAAALDQYGARLAEVKALHARVQALRRESAELKEDLERLHPDLLRLHAMILELGYPVEELVPTTGSLNRLAVSLEQISQHLELAKVLEAAELAVTGIEQEIKELSSEEPSLREIAAAKEEADPASRLQEVIQAGEKRAYYQKAVDERETLAQRMKHSLGRREVTALQSALKEVAVAREIGEEEMPNARDYVQILSLLYSEYFSQGDSEEALDQAEQAVSYMKRELQELVEEREDLSREIETLDTDQTLAEAQRTIDQARSQLEPLAFKYGAHKVAALLLETLHTQFIEEVKDTLLIRASELLRIMTDGEYQEISPLDELTEAGFQVTLDDGETLLPTSLSRGTIEQLFLAVRLGRIQEIEPALPVIFDDSLVNFDTRHAHQAVRAIVDLSKRHQVFVLTCHPELVDMIGEVGATEPVQYWQLDRGVFTRASRPGLTEFLK